MSFVHQIRLRLCRKSEYRSEVRWTPAGMERVILPPTGGAGRASRSRIIRENLFTVVEMCLSKGPATSSASVFEEIAAIEDNSCQERESNLGLSNATDDFALCRSFFNTDNSKNNYKFKN